MCTEEFERTVIFISLNTAIIWFINIIYIAYWMTVKPCKSFYVVDDKKKYLNTVELRTNSAHCIKYFSSYTIY